MPRFSIGSSWFTRPSLSFAFVPASFSAITISSYGCRRGHLRRVHWLVVARFLRQVATRWPGRGKRGPKTGRQGSPRPAKDSQPRLESGRSAAAASGNHGLAGGRDPAGGSGRGCLAGEGIPLPLDAEASLPGRVRVEPLPRVDRDCRLSRPPHHAGPTRGGDRIGAPNLFLRETQGGYGPYLLLPPCREATLRRTNAAGAMPANRGGKARVSRVRAR